MTHLIEVGKLIVFSGGDYVPKGTTTCEWLDSVRGLLPTGTKLYAAKEGSVTATDLRSQFLATIAAFTSLSEEMRYALADTLLAKVPLVNSLNQEPVAWRYKAAFDHHNNYVYYEDGPLRPGRGLTAVGAHALYSVPPDLASLEATCNELREQVATLKEQLAKQGSK